MSYTPSFPTRNADVSFFGYIRVSYIILEGGKSPSKGRHFYFNQTLRVLPDLYWMMFKPHCKLS